MNQGIHQIDLLLWFMGKAKRVTAQTKTILHKGLEVEDLATAQIEFENGAFGTIEGSTAMWPGFPARVDVYGVDGAAWIEDGELQYWNFKKNRASDRKIQEQLHAEAALGSGASDPLASLKVEGHRRQIEDFTKAIQQGRPPTIDGREGRNAVELIETIYKAANTGRPVTIKG